MKGKIKIKQKNVNEMKSNCSAVKCNLPTKEKDWFSND